MVISPTDYIVNMQPDQANTSGQNMLSTLESTAVGALQGVTAAIAPNGRMPYDPSDPNFQSLIQVRGTTGQAVNVGTSSPGLLILIIILIVFLTRGKKSAPAGEGGLNP